MSSIDLMPAPSGAQFPTVVTVPREKPTAFLKTCLGTLSPKTSVAKSRESTGLCQGELILSVLTFLGEVLQILRALKFIFSWSYLIFRWLFHQQIIFARYSWLQSWFCWCCVTSNLSHTSFLHGLSSQTQTDASGYTASSLWSHVTLLLIPKGKARN